MPWSISIVCLRPNKVSNNLRFINRSKANQPPLNAGWSPDVKLGLLTFVLLVLAVAAILFVAHNNYRRRSKYYVNFKNWWEVTKPETAQDNPSTMR